MRTKEEALAQIETLTQKLIRPSVYLQKEFAQAVRDFREATGLTPNEFARCCGKALQTTYRWETVGLRQQESARRVCKIFREIVLPNPQNKSAAPDDGRNTYFAKVSITVELPAGAITGFLAELLEKHGVTVHTL